VSAHGSRSARSTWSFSPRTSSASHVFGGSIAVRPALEQWFCTMSRSTPVCRRTPARADATVSAAQIST
jgi:hypothetical protein